MTVLEIMYTADVGHFSETEACQYPFGDDCASTRVAIYEDWLLFFYLLMCEQGQDSQWNIFRIRQAANLELISRSNIEQGGAGL